MTAREALTAGVITSLALLLALAGTGKLRRPGTAAAALAAAGMSRARLVVAVLAVTELAVAGAALILPTHVAGLAQAGAFAALAGGSAVARRRAGAVACGCFGDEGDAGFGTRQVATNAAAAAAAGAAALLATSGPGAPGAPGAPGVSGVSASVAALAGRAPAAITVLLLVAAATAAALRWWLRGGGLSAMDRSATALVDASAWAVEGRFSRRSLLLRLAVGGSALAIAPLRYLLYPVSALAVVSPADCRDGLCSDGWTAFCCQIDAGLNACPRDTFPGGWWMCTDYPGSQLCHDAGIRYYVDCNALPHRTFPGGCRCAGDTCEHRRVACNVFRYGQCNTHVRGTTAVVCRMVTCVNPSTIPHLNCSASLAVEDAVCAQEAPCLQPMAVPLAGAGGV